MTRRLPAAYGRWDRANHLSGCVGPKVLQLKRNAQVMLLKNLDQARKLVNGSRGIVVDFRPQPSHGAARRAASADVDEAPESSSPLDVEGAPNARSRLYPLVQFQVAPGVWESQLVVPEEWTVEDGGREVAKRVQVPLKLA